jgi:hypothetical protein
VSIPQRVFEETILAFLAPVAPFLEDPTVTEVMINGPFEIFVERRGRIERTDARFDGTARAGRGGAESGPVRRTPRVGGSADPRGATCRTARASRR